MYVTPRRVLPSSVRWFLPILLQVLEVLGWTRALISQRYHHADDKRHPQDVSPQPSIEHGYALPVCNAKKHFVPQTGLTTAHPYG